MKSDYILIVVGEKTGHAVFVEVGLPI